MSQSHRRDGGARRVAAAGAGKGTNAALHPRVRTVDTGRDLASFAPDRDDTTPAPHAAWLVRTSEAIAQPIPLFRAAPTSSGASNAAVRPRYRHPAGLPCRRVRARAVGLVREGRAQQGYEGLLPGQHV